MGTVFIVLLLLALCGFIAYIGDLLGRRLGKKRLTVFGLRPKHTAILLTVVTGVLIASVTFAAALVTLPWFRKVVTQGERLANQNSRLRANNDTLNRTNVEGEQQNRLLERRLQNLRVQKQRLSGENRKLVGDNQGLTTQNTALQQQSAQLRGQAGQLRAANAVMHQHNDELRSRAEQLTAGTHRLEAEQARLSTEIRNLHGQVREARQEASKYQQVDYTTPRDWQLATIPILPNSPVEVLHSIMRSLIFRAREAATRHKAAAPHGKDVVYLVRPRDYPAGRPVTTPAILDWAVAQISRIRNQALGVRVLAGANCLAGEAVPLRIDWYANDLVFHKDEVISARMIDGAATRGQILEDLVFLLRFGVTPIAFRRSMYPQEDDEAIGQLRYDELLQLCDKLREKGAPVLVEAVARKDTYRSGPLYVDFHLRPAMER